jgi:hypothetical protein
MVEELEGTIYEGKLFISLTIAKNHMAKERNSVIF